MRQEAIIGFWCATLALGGLSAATVPGRWEKMAAQEPEIEIKVVLADGRHSSFFYRGIDADCLVVSATPDGPELRLEKQGIERIETAATRKDTLRNGVLIGGLIGFGAGFVGTAAYNAHATASGPIWDGEAVAIYLGPALLGLAAGAAAGALLDKVHEAREVLYQAP